MSTPLVIAILIAASLSGTAIMAFAIHRSRQSAAALRALCTTRGWHYAQGKASGLAPSTTTISDPDANWRLEIISGANSPTTNSTGVRRTIWTDPAARIGAGLAVIGPAMPGEKAEGAERLLSMMGGRMGAAVMEKMFGVLGPDATRLQAVTAPDAHGLMLATPDAQDALLAVARHPDLAQAGDTLREGDMPSVIRSPEGLQLHLRKALRDPDRIVALVALGQSLSAAARG